MRALTSLATIVMAALSIPIMIFNFAAPFVAGIWLGYLGEWSLIGVGIAFLFVGVFAISIALLPALALGAAAATAEQRGSTVGAIVLAIPAMAWTLFLAGATCTYAMYFAYNEIDHEGSWIPYILWAIVIATAPWDYMAMKEAQASRDVSDSMVTASFLNLGCIASFVGIWSLDRTELLEIAWPIGIAIALAQVLNLMYALARSRARSNFEF